MEDRSILGNSTTILCFSHLRWNFVYQRPQHLLSRAARRNRVLFVEEPTFEDTSAPRLSIRVAPEGVQVVVPVIPINYVESEAADAVRDLVEDLVQDLRSGNTVLWYYTPMALPISANIPADVCVYDNMDELSLFRGASPLMMDLENKLFDRADIVFTGGLSLYEAKRARHSNIHPVPSSIDVTHFGRARNSELTDPHDQASIKKPRLGFFGVIDERMNLELVEQLAEMKPHWQFVMIGPVVKIDPKSLPTPSNIHWLGTKSYEELPQYLAGWDLGLMPFALNEATRFISPTKTPEYLAAGIPIISTPIRDVVRPYGELGLVEIATDAKSFVVKANSIFEQERRPWLRSVDKHLDTMSWDLTWQKMEQLIEETASRSNPVKAKGEHIHV